MPKKDVGLNVVFSCTYNEIETVKFNEIPKFKMKDESALKIRMHFIHSPTNAIE